MNHNLFSLLSQILYAILIDSSSWIDKYVTIYILGRTNFTPHGVMYH